MPKGFVSVWCEVCRGAFRNRQSLFRHLRKTDCGGNDNDPSSSVGMIPAVDAAQTERNNLADLLDQLTLKLPGLVKDRYLDDIGDIVERHGISNPFSSKENVFEAWSHQNGADIVMDLTKSPIPNHIGSGTKIGTIAIYLKGSVFLTLIS
jgi:hypothetical protein